MATKNKNSKKNKSSILKLVLLLALFLLLSLIVTAIGAEDDAPELWISIVDFSESVKLHFTSLWMFYTFGLAVLIAYLNRK